MELVAQPRGLGQRVRAFGDQQVQHRSLVLRGHGRQGRGLGLDQRGDRVGVQGVALARLAGAATLLGRPARVDLVDGLALGDQALGEPAPVVPRAFDAPLARARPPRRPAQQLLPVLGRYVSTYMRQVCSVLRERRVGLPPRGARRLEPSPPRARVKRSLRSAAA